MVPFERVTPSTGPVEAVRVFLGRDPHPPTPTGTCRRLNGRTVLLIYLKRRYPWSGENPLTRRHLGLLRRGQGTPYSSSVSTLVA